MMPCHLYGHLGNSLLLVLVIPLLQHIPGKADFRIVALSTRLFDQSASGLSYYQDCEHDNLRILTNTASEMLKTG